MKTRDEIEQMMAQIALRDRSAFAALYDATNGKLFSVCLRVLRNRTDAEEALQEIYLRIWNKADQYAVTGHSPMTWLITVTRNHCIDRLRQKTRRSEEGGDLTTFADHTPGPEAQVIAKSERSAIDGCLDELTPEHSQAVRQAYLDGDTYAALAERFDIPLNTVRTWLRRSLLKLRDCLTR